MPMIIASAVISTGRNRVLPASIAAVIASAPAAMRSRAKLITRMLFAVATPMHMIAPVSAGTESVVPVANSIQTMPASARRQRHDDDERIEPRLEVDDDQQVDQHDGEGETDEELLIGARHRRHLAAQHDAGAVRHVVRGRLHRLADVGGDAAEIASLRRRDRCR